MDFRLNLGASDVVVEDRRERLQSPPGFWPPAPVTFRDLAFRLPMAANMP